jgi:WD40 repeat protein
LHDISSDGRLLMSHDNSRTEIQGLPPQERAERNLSWYDWSIAGDLSDDGRTLLFTEAGEASGSQYSVYMRETGRSSASRIGDGFALALSRDGKWALALVQIADSRLMLLPINDTDKPTVLRCDDINCQPWGSLLPDGQILFVGNQQGRGSRLYLQQRIGAGVPRPITPEGVRIFSSRAIAPDGKLIAATAADRMIYIYDLERNEPSAVPGVIPGEVPIQWKSDGSSIYVFCRGEVPAKIFEINIATGERTFCKQLVPTDPTGVHEIVRVLVTPDLSSHVFSYTRDFSELYLVEGLK